MKHFLMIFHAYFNWISGLISGKIDDKAIERYLICKDCEYKKFGVCKICGCFIRPKCSGEYIVDEDGKTLDGCPIRKW